MQTLKTKLIAVAALAALALTSALIMPRDAAAQSGPQVTISNPLPLPVSGSVQVGNIDSEDRQVFRKFVDLNFDGQKSNSIQFTAPADKQIVIDAVAGRCFVAVGSLCNFSIGAGASETILYTFPTSKVIQPLDLDMFAFHGTTRFVIRPGEVYYVRGDRNINAGVSGVRVTLTGHYVDCTPASSCPATIN